MKHTYQNSKRQIITETLPPGQFLKVGEKLKKGDWRLWKDSKHNIVSSKCHWWGQVGQELDPIYSHSFYRPTTPKYRILKPNEIIRKGDQLYDKDTRGWSNSVRSCGETVKDRLFAGSRFSRVRRPIKTK